MIQTQQVIKWLNIFLLIINLSALVTFLFMNKEKQPEYDTRFSSNEFLKKELNLSEQQYDSLVVMNTRVFQFYQLLLDKRCEYNFALVDELTSSNPSNHKLDSLTTRIGKIDANLKRQTINHFKNVQAICTDTQKTQLGRILKEMIEVGNECKYCNKVSCDRRQQLEKK